jgi:hypothetical protein
VAEMNERLLELEKLVHSAGKSGMGMMGMGMMMMRGHHVGRRRLLVCAQGSGVA